MSSKKPRRTLKDLSTFLKGQEDLISSSDSSSIDYAKLPPFESSVQTLKHIEFDQNWQILKNIEQIESFINLDNKEDLLQNIQKQADNSGSPEVKEILKRASKEIQKSRNKRQYPEILEKVIQGLEDVRIREVLQKTVDAERNSCQQLYQCLEAKLAILVGNKGEIVTATFPWRTRVGGMLGFRERLLPAMHPVYGIPYVPASSIKGVVRAWARDHQKSESDRLLGCLDGKRANVAAVQILDAFPIAPCLSMDIANPQWKWNGDAVRYGTVPHPLLSLENLTLKIGLLPTSRGNHADVLTVKQWLEQALLSEGLGSRVSAGYGRASEVNQKKALTIQLAHVSQHPFELRSQGMYGASTTQAEFRPTAIRGILRYWFRAVALSLYSPNRCRDLEDTLFGTLEPRKKKGEKSRAIVGSIRVAANLTSSPSGNPSASKLFAEQDFAEQGFAKQGFAKQGTLHLEAKTEKHLVLIQHVLKLAAHLGGVGRGSRRPLHWNSGLRGCYWQLTSASDRLNCDLQEWQSFLESVKRAFIDVQALDHPGIGSPGDPSRKERFQDVLNQNARICLVPCPKLKHPKDLRDWRKEGDKPLVRGRALEFLYKSGYKGVNRQNQGNQWVGGKLGTPSFVWISSNNLDQPQQAYQVITLFGVKQDDPQGYREKFIQGLREDKETQNAIFVPSPLFSLQG